MSKLILGSLAAVLASSVAMGMAFAEVPMTFVPQNDPMETCSAWTASHLSDPRGPIALAQDAFVMGFVRGVGLAGMSANALQYTGMVPQTNYEIAAISLYCRIHPGDTLQTAAVDFAGRVWRPTPAWR